MGILKKVAGSYAVFLKVFGLHVVVCKWVGNCFSPALVVEWHGIKKPFTFQGKKRMAAWATITFRTSNFLETHIYFRGYKGFDWNSEHIAVRFGKVEEADHGDCYFYKGWLGYHASV